MESVHKFYKRLGVCPDCRKVNPEPGHTYCPKCEERRRNYVKNLPPEKRRQYIENRKASNNLTYARRRAAGLCVRCGAPTRGGNSMCDVHIEQSREYGREYYRRQHPEKPAGNCRNCDEPALPGKKLCRYHYDLACRNLAQARTKRKKEENTK